MDAAFSEQGNYIYQFGKLMLLESLNIILILYIQVLKKSLIYDQLLVCLADSDVGTVIFGSVGSQHAELGEEGRGRGRGKRKKPQPSDEPALKRRTQAFFHVVTASSSSQTGSEETCQVWPYNL